MLPDFPGLKNRISGQLLRFVRAQIPILEPALSNAAAYRQHEGRDTLMERADGSSESLDYPRAEFKLQMSKAEMRTLDMNALRAQLVGLAQQIAEHQSGMMFARIAEAAEAVGNTVATGGELKPEHILEMMRQIQTDFDPITEERKPGLAWVMHPDMAEKVRAKVSAWERDPNFTEAVRRAEEEQREAWRAREARRKLVD